MKILMIAPHYEPDLGPSAPLFTMLAVELVSRGHQVIVLTTVPHYPTGVVPPEYHGKWIQPSIENGVEVIRIRIPSLKRSNFAGRFLQFICYQVGAVWAGLSQKYDAAFVANPALWVWLPFAILCVLRRKPAIFSVYDVYPDIGIQLGIFRNRCVISLVAALEKYCLRRSRIVRVISDSFRPALHRLGVPDGKILRVYDWVDTRLIQPVAKDNPFSRTHGLANHFVVLYAGNLGLSQGLESILAVAAQLKSEPDIQFVFVGDGAGRADLVEEARKRGLTNVTFLPFQPRQSLPNVLGSANVSLVVLKKGVGFNSLPNKTLSILASNRPIIASVDEDSETWRLVQQSGAGVCVPPEDPSALQQAILNLRINAALCIQMGDNGRRWALKHHSPQFAGEVFEGLFQSILS